jgi:hypothetical protein
MSWSGNWNLPAPLGLVRLSESSIRHIFAEHVENPWEFWESLLTDPPLQRLRQCWRQEDICHG